MLPLKPIRFTHHAYEKMAIAARRGFIFYQDQIIDGLRHPNNVFQGNQDRSIIHFPLDSQHILRVIYEENGEIIVVTAYPARRSRYEI